MASGPLGVVRAADQEIGRQTALRARAVAEFAATRPASADRPSEQPGSMGADRRAARPEVLAVGWWAAADRAVEAAGEALLEMDRRLVRAGSAVERAEIADADDEARQQSPAAAMTNATCSAARAVTAWSTDR